jgi:nicotinate-nucleotide pyrophosphorylase (carboxylating)
MLDIRDDIFRDVMDQAVTAVIYADAAGVIAGTQTAAAKALELGVFLAHIIEDGKKVHPGHEVARISGTPKQIAMAEDLLMGCMAKPSGIATAAARCVQAADGKVTIVCGSWKKMPNAIKHTVRGAIAVGGAELRISPPPFVYLDKNYVRMLGGIEKSLQAVAHLSGHKKAIQIKGAEADIALEAVAAARLRADIINIDTGNPADITAVSEVLGKERLRTSVKVAFGGNVNISDIATLTSMDVDMLCIGKAIIDAPLLDLKMEVN